MTAPKTMLQMAGADPQPSALSDSALVIIDAQREYLDGKVPLVGIEPALDKLAALLARARAAGTTIIHILQQGKPGGAFDPEGPGHKPADQAMPADGETIIGKTLPNSFAGTTLDDALKAAGSKPLILAGFMTHVCVSSTARAALDLGYSTTIASDAVATRDLPDTAGGVLAASDVHKAELAALADRFAAVAPVDEIPD